MEMALCKDVRDVISAMAANETVPSSFLTVSLSVLEAIRESTFPNAHVSFCIREEKSSDQRQKISRIPGKSQSCVIHVH